jgi:tetratricopeptide (TPR) repeat protein
MTLPFPTPEDRITATLAFNEGVEAMRQGDDATAIAHWQRAAGIDESMAPALHNLVVYHEEQKQFDKVAALYDKLLRIDPFHPRSLVRQAAAYRRTQRIEQAIANYERAIRVHPWYRHWYEELADLYDTRGQRGIATTLRQRASKLDHDEAEMACDDGVRCIKKGNLPLAAACFEAVLDELPGHLEARIHLSECLFETGSPDEALHHLAIALEQAPETPAIVRYHRARFYYHLQRYDEARTELRIALELEPSYGRAEYLLALVELSSLPPDKPEVSSPPAAAAKRGTSDHTSASPVAVNGGDSWEDIATTLLQDAIARAHTQGENPRFALLIEPNVALAPIAMRLLELVKRLKIVGDSAGIEPVYVVESETRPGEGVAGVIREGWLGSDLIPDLRGLSWSNVTSGLPLDHMFNSAIGASSRGFDLMLVLSTGRARGDQSSLARITRSARVGHIAHVAPSGYPSDVTARLMTITPAFTDIAF